MWSTVAWLLLVVGVANAANFEAVAYLKGDTVGKFANFIAEVRFQSTVASGISDTMVSFKTGKIPPHLLDSPFSIHISTYGDLRGEMVWENGVPSGSVSAGPHYNPDGKNDHACFNGTDSPTPDHHVGDLGSFNVSADGTVTVSWGPIPYLYLAGPRSIIGRAVILNIGDGCSNKFMGDEATLGPAFGVIGIAQPSKGTTNDAAGDLTFNSYDGLVCVMRGTTNNCQDPISCDIKKSGFFRILSLGQNSVRVIGLVSNLQTARAVHIHEWGDITDEATGLKTGGHFNPDKNLHNFPSEQNRHMGDLGNIQTFQNGIGYYDNDITYSGSTPLNLGVLVGRSMVVHTGIDHGNHSSCPNVDLPNFTGDAGARMHQCVIGYFNRVTPGVRIRDYTVWIPDDLVYNNTNHNTPCDPRPSSSSSSSSSSSTGPSSESSSSGSSSPSESSSSTGGNDAVSSASSIVSVSLWSTVAAIVLSLYKLVA